MLTALDETLLHQSPHTFDQTSYSDHRFFDRMWLGGHCRDARFFMGMAVYKNTNTVDGFFSVLLAGKQYNLRASRPLLPNPDQLSVGPIALEIVKPLEEIRLLVAARADHPFEADLRFRATVPVRLESPHHTRVDGRITQDYVRFDQHGHIGGWFSVDGKRTVADGWFGARDHSWGVRPGTGGYEPSTRPVVDDSYGAQLTEGAGWMGIYMFFETQNFSGYIQHQEDGEGKVLYNDGSVKRRDHGEARIVKLTHDLAFVRGTRTCGSGDLSCTLEDGATVSVKFQSLLPGSVYKGTGYDHGFDDERGLGFHRGNRIEADVYDVSDVEKVVMPDGRVIRPWQRELPCTVEVGGESGMGYAAVLNNGPINRYGVAGEYTNRRPGGRS